MLPTIRIGEHEFTRLIVGGNPFSGNSHVNGAMNEEMMNYFTTAKVKETLHRCEECGILVMYSTIRAAFDEAFREIKDTDAVVVGMYPRDLDQPLLNSRYAMEAIQKAR